MKPKVRWLIVVPQLFFLILLASSTYRSIQRPQHNFCLQLWQKKEWNQITAMAENLWRLKTPDAESTCFALLAAKQKQDSQLVRVFGERLLSLKIINWKMESEVHSAMSANGFFQAVRLSRTKFVSAIMILFIILQAASMRQGKLSAFTSYLALLGCLLLII